MASFTDEIQKFNPYISQIPVDAYSTVERYKQTQYDEGVQRIDNAFSQIAGLPVDEKYSGYVNSALGKLNDGVKKIAGSDFSNMQLVNQIEGAARSIAADPIIQNGVLSAANHKSNLNQMQEDKKNGKLSPDNQWDYSQQYAQWKLNPDLSMPFQGSYYTHIDLNKKWLDVLKSINPSAKLEDVPFEIDGNGNVDYSKMATAMVERGYKGVSPQQIETAIRSSMDENDLNQIRISGNYRFRNYTPDNLVQISNQKYDAQKQELLSKKTRIEAQLKTTPETTELGGQLKSSLDYINEMLGNENQKGKLDLQREAEVVSIRNNPEVAKTDIYKNGYINQFSKAFSYMDESTKYVESPFTKYQMDLNNLNLRMQSENRQVAEFKYKMQQDAIDNAFKERDLLVKEGKAGPGQAGMFTTDLGIATDKALSGVATVQNLANQANAEAEALKVQLGQSTAVAGETPNEQRARVNSLIAKYQDGTQTNLPANIKGTIGSIVKLSSQSATYTDFLRNSQNSIDNAYKNTPQFQQLQQAINSRHSLRLGDYNFSPQEIVDYLRKESLITTTGSMQGLKDIDSSSLSQKEKILYDYVKSGRYTANATPSPYQETVNKYFNDFTPLIEANKNLIQQRNQSLNDYISTRAPNVIPTLGTIDLPDSKTRNTILGRVDNVLNRISGSIDGNKGGNEGLDVDEAKDLITNSKKRDNTNVQFLNQPGNYYLILSNGDNVQKIKLTDKEAEQFNSQTSNVNSELSNRISMGGGLTTNYLGTPDGSYYQKTDFPNVKGLNVRADLRPVPGSKDAAGNPMFNIEYNVQTPNGWRKLELPTPITATQAQFNIQNVRDEDLLKAYKDAGLIQ